MTQRIDWDQAYRQETAPAWSIGEPQPALAALLDVDGAVTGDVLDVGCGQAELSLALAARGHTVVGIDLSPAAIAAAQAAARERGLAGVVFQQADCTVFAEYPPGSEERFATIFDSGLLHALPVGLRADYLRAVHRAAAPGATFYLLAFGAGAFPDHDGPAPAQFEEAELRDVLSTCWRVERISPAVLYARVDAPADELPQQSARNGGLLQLPGFVVTANKER